MQTPDSPTDTGLASLEWPQLLDALRARLAGDYGRAALERLGFLDDVRAIRDSLLSIQEMKTLVAGAGPLPLGSLPPIAPLLERAEKEGRLELPELAAVLATQSGALRAAAALAAGIEYPHLLALAGEVHPEEELLRELGRALTPAGELDERAFPRLAELRAEVASRRQAIHRRLDGLLRSRDLESALQDKLYTLRGRRYVLPVKADFKSHVPGIVHDVSASGATLFVEPQPIVDETNALTLTERQLDIEVDHILRQLSRQVGLSAASLRHNLDWLGRVDLLHAQARLSRDLNACPPDVRDGGEIVLKSLAHPLMLLRGEAVVRNDLRLGAEVRCLVISGANTGGKTVLLKAAGLCALLVRTGMHIPADPGSRLDLFPDVWAEIGDHQDLRSSLSTFSAQVRFLADLMASAGSGSLVLLDELMTGTEPTEGAALARQVLETLVALGAKSIVTTHYGDLKLLAQQVPGVANASVAFDPENLRPTFRLIVGLPGASYAFPIALRHGFPADLVARAEQALAGRPAALDVLLRRVQSEEMRQKDQEAALRQREQAAARREEELTRRAEEVKALLARLKRQERGAVSRELQAARDQIGAVIRELQGANSLPLAGKLRMRLADLERELLTPPPPAAPAPTSAPHRPLAPGDAVFLASLERSGVLSELLDDGAVARVQFGSLTLEIPAEELQPAATAPAGPKPRTLGASARAKAAPIGAEIPHVFPSAENSLDVRGLRLEEALERVEAFFDLCVMKHISPVLVIHGHGTGKLKAGLRLRLGESRYVEAFRPGGEREGRDGATAVALNL
jgi:DNA mismatch repair protein MutS2